MSRKRRTYCPNCKVETIALAEEDDATCIDCARRKANPPKEATGFELLGIERLEDRLTACQRRADRLFDENVRLKGALGRIVRANKAWRATEPGSPDGEALYLQFFTEVAKAEEVLK